MNKILPLLILILLCFTPVQSQELSLKEGFHNPPNSARPKGYWCLVNGNYDLAQMTVELQEFKDKGMGGVDIWDVAGWVDPNGVVPAGPPFMGDESLQAISHGIREAQRIGLDIGLTISSSWNAGGSWVETADGVKGLFETNLQLTGPMSFNGPLNFPSIPEKFEKSTMILEKGADGLPTVYQEVALLAYPTTTDSSFLTGQIIDLSAKLVDGTLNWEVPPGQWTLSRYVSTGTGQPLMRPSPNSDGLMIDHFDAGAMERNLNFFFEKLEQELGSLSQTALKYLYTDSYEANSAVWTSKMPEEFKKRNGYDITPK